MANIFVDTNYFINLYTHRKEVDILKANLENNDLFVSTLTYHIFAYTQKLKIPNQELTETMKVFNLVNLNKKIITNSLEGPTSDLEDNIQLHSAAEAESDYFLTFDKELLKMKFFGKVRIVQDLGKQNFNSR